MQNGLAEFFRGLRAAAFQGTAILDVRESLAAGPLLLKEGMLQHTKRVGEYLKLQLELEQVLAKYDKRVLFGAGNMCRNYMKCYGEKYPPLFTCDNNAAIWGTRFEGLEVKDPEELKKLPEDCAIFICNIYYDEIKSNCKIWDYKIRFTTLMMSLCHHCIWIDLIRK